MPHVCHVVHTVQIGVAPLIKQPTALTPLHQQRLVEADSNVGPIVLQALLQGYRRAGARGAGGVADGGGARVAAVFFNSSAVVAAAGAAAHVADGGVQHSIAVAFLLLCFRVVSVMLVLHCLHDPCFGAAR